MTNLDLTWNFRTPDQDNHFFKDSVRCFGMVSDLQDNHCHVPMSPNDNTFIVGTDTTQAFINACPHKQTKLFGNSSACAGKIVCPLHHWTFDSTGTFISGRGFNSTPDMSLTKSPVYTWQGFIMSGDNNWVQTINKELENDLDLFTGNNYSIWKREHLESNFDWKIFLEIYLDLYHVRSAHPSLRSVIDINDYKYSFGDGWSCMHAHIDNVGSKLKKYEKAHRWVSACEELGLFNTPCKIIWLVIYPNVMLEIYPGCIIVSQVYPNGIGKNKSTLEFYFDNEIMNINPDFAQITYDFWMETADEDEEICEQIQEGRKNMTAICNKLPLFNHTVEEAANTHWFEWMREKDNE